MNISAIALAGLQQAQAELEHAVKPPEPSAPSTPPGGPVAPVDAISLSHEAVALMVARTQFDVNITALNAAYEAEKALLEAT